MMRLTRIRRGLLVGLAAAAATVALAPAANAEPTLPDVPPEIAVPAGHTISLAAHAAGVQIYTCDGSAWSAATPRANLYRTLQYSQIIAKHFGGPTWQSTIPDDSSSVVGVVPPAGSVTVDTTAIPWLLLAARPAATPGVFADTAYIQRVNTGGGLAPAAAECNAENKDEVEEVHYTADYFFWKKS